MNSCNNPFAPGLMDDSHSGPVLGDQRTVDGVFQNFRYAYNFKDTIVYGALLDDEFVFVYRNYEKNMDVSWGRDEDMYTTNGLFQAAQNLDLIWNEVIVAIGDSLLLDISRGFNLTITFTPIDIINIQGRANFRLKRNSNKDVWKIIRWRDESNY